GPEGDLAWQLASGTDCEPLRPQRRCVQLVEHLSLETPLSGRQPLLVAWEQTLCLLMRQQRFRCLAARQAELDAATALARDWSLVVTFKEPLADVRQMWSARRAALDEALFPGPLSELSIELRGLGPALGHQLALLRARSTMRSRLEEGLRQLKARYGYCPVGRVGGGGPWNRIPERKLGHLGFDP